MSKALSQEKTALPPKSVRRSAEFGANWSADGLWDDGHRRKFPPASQAHASQAHASQAHASQAHASQAHASQEKECGAWQMPGADRSLEVSVVFDVCPPEAQAGLSAGIGGDFADVIPLRGNWVALVLADVCGKGPAAALCVPQTLYALRQILSGPADDCRDPACALNRLNRYLCSTALPAVCASAALALIVMDTGTGEALCACAGAEPPLILRAGGQAEAVGAGRMALGVDAGRDYRTVDFLLGRGDALLLATDGITLARRAGGDEGENSLNYEGLTGLALNAFWAGSSAGRVARAVLSGARAFAGGTFQDHASVLVAARW